MADLLSAIQSTQGASSFLLPSASGPRWFHLALHCEGRAGVHDYPDVRSNGRPAERRIRRIGPPWFGNSIFIESILTRSSEQTVH
jgi:hypothetical protein